MVKASNIFLTGIKDRYELIYAIGAYKEYHAPMPNDASSGCVRSIPST